jgi:hypothetical protein
MNRHGAQYTVVAALLGSAESVLTSRALAEAASELYQVPVDKLMEYGKHRAAAMKIRDTKILSERGVTEADWQAIEIDLQASWQSLWKALQT